jgi:1-acyl-sn-glycerol-3-phosphate acyltransferase
VIRALLGRAWLRAFGWQLAPAPPLPKKFVFICAPHTSNWDLPFTLAVGWSMGLDIRWLGKHTIFRWPFGPFMRALGGIPVDRRSPHGMVGEVAQRFAESESLLIGIPPEGTRAKVARWKSGFYHIACAAEVPIGLGFLDFARRRGGVGGFITPTGDVRADMAKVRAFYTDIRGKLPELESETVLKEELN